MPELGRRVESKPLPAGPLFLLAVEVVVETLGGVARLVTQAVVKHLPALLRLALLPGVRSE